MSWEDLKEVLEIDHEATKRDMELTRLMAENNQLQAEGVVGTVAALRALSTPSDDVVGAILGNPT